VAGQFVVGFGLALLLNRPIPGKGLLTTLLLLPMMLSPVVVGQFWKLIYDPSWGILNHALGLGKVAWLSDANLALYAVAITDIWMWSPFVMLLSLAGLSAVPKHLYEAASIDRAGRLYTFFRITLPLVAPILLIAVIFRTMEAFKTFDVAFVMTGQPSAELISSRLYKMAFQQWQTGPSSALAYIILIMVLCITNIYVKYLNKAKERWDGRRLVTRRSVGHPPRHCRRHRRHPDLPGADLLDHVDGVQAAGARHLGPADRRLRARDHA